MNRGVFITGTDTEVGKTVVSAGIAGALKARDINVGVMKPVATGAMMTEEGLISGDVEFLLKSIGSDDPRKLINPVSIELPLAPLVACRLDGIQIDLNTITDAFQRLIRTKEFVVVEGIGGVWVPITEDYFVFDMIEDLGLPVVVVARAGLGTINHTLLTIKALQHREIPIKGFIINGINEKEATIAEKTNPKIIEEISSIPLLGILPFDPTIDVPSLETGDLIELTSRHVDLSTILL